MTNGLKKYMAFMLGKTLAFVDSIRFKNSSLQKFTQNLKKYKFE